MTSSNWTAIQSILSLILLSFDRRPKIFLKQKSIIPPETDCVLLHLLQAAKAFVFNSNADAHGIGKW
jgi:hypothetical protein